MKVKIREAWGSRAIWKVMLRSLAPSVPVASVNWVGRLLK
jgi:hypothetical protein